MVSPARSVSGAAFPPRAGLLTDYDNEFLRTASRYFEALISWYVSARLDVEGKAAFAAVTESLARGGLQSALNPAT